MTLATWAWLGALLIVTAGWAAIAAAGLRTRRNLPSLTDLPLDLPDPSPLLSVVAPSRDEAEGVEAGTRSLLAQDYPALEVIAVDDRSRDVTGAILDRLAAEDPRVRVVHVTELSPGWVGKNHANHLGASAARGEWLLFTDGDVIVGRGALRRAVAYAVAHDLGHLVALPHFVAPGFLERAFVGTFIVFLNLKFRPWALRKPRSLSYIGIGAFNLVRRDAYQRVGGHARLAMEVVDDLKLGLILRRSGIRQGAVDSGGLLRVRWNKGFVATARGLLKSNFAAAEFRWRTAVLDTLFMTGIALVPVAALVAAPAPLGALALLATVLALTVHAGAARRLAGGSGVESFVYPFSLTVLAAVSLLSPITVTLRGGIEWRGTLYPLVALREGCVRERDWPVSGAVGW